VHDELVLEVSADAPTVQQVGAAIRERMVAAGEGALSVPLRVDIGTGPNWDEAH